MNTIREARSKLKLTQAELGTHLGVAGNTVARWERGLSSPEYPEMLELALLGLETKLKNFTPREKIRKFEDIHASHKRTADILQEMDA